MTSPYDMPYYLLRCGTCRKIVKYYGEYPSSGNCRYPPCDGKLKVIAVFDPIKQQEIIERVGDS